MPGPNVPRLPTGYRSAPVRPADLPEIEALLADCERELTGRPEAGAGRVAADLARPGLVPELDTVVVRDPAGVVAGWAWVDRRSVVRVRPGHRGRGLGAALLDWAETRARQVGAEQITQVVPDADAAAGVLLRSRGYRPRVTEWLLEYRTADGPPTDEPPTDGPPADGAPTDGPSGAPAGLPGVTVRPYREGDGPALHALVQDAFDEWQQRRHAYPEWAAHTVGHPGFAPAATLLALTGGRLLGATVSLHSQSPDEGWIEQLAVHPAHRRRGLARHLLHRTFRAFHALGRPVTTLGTHSATGALDLYLHVGMHVRRSSTVHRKELAHSREPR
ncbi:GNAT family N-acetyltransferase [Kitasatospora sp. NPDC096147]|uniref:GNAT family N-acetyltransferase n=1 Tax=Kitasatospora sp. NPDC096147 TaxID=3364093 RepID=UPI003808D446